MIGLLNFVAADTVLANEAYNTASSLNKEPVQVILQSQSKYFTSSKLLYGTGESIQMDVINGPPTPPAGYALERSAVVLPESMQKNGMKSLAVPTYRWVLGCSSVSAAMIAAYYDRNGFPHIYTGPTNGGVMPLDSSYWPTWTDGHQIYPNLPLAGSHQGVDGRTARGSLDDYWMYYGSTDNDPFISQGWNQHSWGDAIGDYMRTSQSASNNSDGSTCFYNYPGSATRLTCDDMTSYLIHTNDGTYGRKLFYEARGYKVIECYNQNTDNNVEGGFSFDQFKAEIDANRPVLLNLKGHSVVGVGYDDYNATVYINDTWDYNNHAMKWGGSYAGMPLMSVSIVNLQRPSTPGNQTPGVTSKMIMPWINLLLDL